VASWRTYLCHISSGCKKFSYLTCIRKNEVLTLVIKEQLLELKVESTAESNEGMEPGM
jgi:hypothetical protein